MSRLPSEKKYILYQHTSPNGKVYVGITSRKPNARWGTQGQGYKSNKHFYSAIQKYGWDNFTHAIILSDLSLADACEEEQRLIQETKSDNPLYGYNIAQGGQMTSTAASTRKKLSEKMAAYMNDPENRERIRQASINNWKNEKYRQAHSGQNAPRYGKHLSEASRKKISEARKAAGYKPWCTGKKMTDEFRRKLSEAQKLHSPHRKHTEEERLKISLSKRGEKNPNYGKPMNEKCRAALLDKNCKPVKQLLNGVVVCIFNSSAEASRQTGICQNNINRCANGKRKTAGGYSWSFANV